MLAPVRFDAETHTYTDPVTGELVTHITEYLKRAKDKNGNPLVDDRWYTEEASARGTAVHAITALRDMGEAIPCPTAYLGYVAGYELAIKQLDPVFEYVEVPLRHGALDLAGRPDRVGRFLGCAGIVEIKTGVVVDLAHRMQTALQAILVASEFHLPPEGLVRYCIYVNRKGRAVVERHNRAADIAQALGYIREHGRRAA